MGYDARTYVIAGARLREVVSIRMGYVPTGKTKFDPDTGEPYPEMTKVAVLDFNGKALQELDVDPSWFAGVESLDYFVGEGGFGPDLFATCAGCEADASKTGVVGLIVGELNVKYDENPQTIEDTSVAIEKARETLSRYNYSGEIELFLVVYESY